AWMSTQCGYLDAKDATNRAVFVIDSEVAVNKRSLAKSRCAPDGAAASPTYGRDSVHMVQPVRVVSTTKSIAGSVSAWPTTGSVYPDVSVPSASQRSSEMSMGYTGWLMPIDASTTAPAISSGVVLSSASVSTSWILASSFAWSPRS